VSMTPFSLALEGPADPSVLGDKDSPKVGKFTHPSGAPDNHMLTIYSPGPVNHQYTFLPQLDGGIYLVKNGDVVEQPADMLLIKNDPQYNESWPRAVVPYERIYGMAEPRNLDRLANDGSLSPHLPEGTPFGLVGTSSLYKRESYPNGAVPDGEVTATFAGKDDPWRGLDAFTSHGNGMPLNWHNQGGDAGLYTNDDIHAIRILAMEPTTDRHRGPDNGRRFHNHAKERLRILGEIPVRKFDDSGDQPLDPDGNPDTSFLAKIPADVAWTFQTLDKDGMVLNSSQTWHQLRPGEIRHDCGGCHAHSQQPTPFAETAAASPDYKLFDLTQSTPLLTSKSEDQSSRKWDQDDSTGLRYAETGVVNVEYHRDIKPILARSCVACHTAKDGNEPAGNLVLDDEEPADTTGRYISGRMPGTYLRLALDEGQGGRAPRFGHPPLAGTWRNQSASRYIRKFQSRRSLLVWKIHGRRTDGWQNEDFPTETTPGDPATLAYQGKPLEPNIRNLREADLDFTGSVMPPPEAVKAGKVQPLSDEDRRTIVRWIDLGCPIDLDHQPQQPDRRGLGWMCDDNRPTLTVAEPAAGRNERIDRILIGMQDYYSGLDLDSFRVVADFALGAAKPGDDVAAAFKSVSPGVWELKLSEPIGSLKEGKLEVSVQDRQGNVTRIERVLSAGRE